MIVTIANQKGGVGKTTLVSLIANYLAQRGKTPLLIDTDHQRSLTYLRQTDAENFPEQEVPYQIIELDLSNPKEVKGYLNELRKEDNVISLLDAPGNLTEDGLLYLLASSDVIIIPFQYERKCLDSTGTFLSVLSQVANHAQTCPKLLFAPNRIRSGEGLKEEKERWAKVNEALANHGTILPAIRDLSCLKRVNTLQLTREQEQACKSTLETIYNALWETSSTDSEV